MRSPIAVLVMLLAGCSGGGGEESAPPETPSHVWTTPDCSRVGTVGGVNAESLNISLDRGQTFISQTATAQLNSPGYAERLDQANTLMAITSQYGTAGQVTNKEILLSTDAGCSWRSTGASFDLLTNGPYLLTRVPDEQAVLTSVTSFDGQVRLVKIETDGDVTELAVDPLPGLRLDPSIPIRINPSDPAHLRAPYTDVNNRLGPLLADSLDGGRSWRERGAGLPLPAVNLAEVHSFGISPWNIDQVIATASTGTADTLRFSVWLSLDGGLSWQQSQLPEIEMPWTLRQVAFASHGTDVYLLIQPGDGFQRQVYVSNDQGLNFSVLPDMAAPMNIGLSLFTVSPHPPHALYFSYSLGFMCIRENFLYQYDPNSRLLQRTDLTFERGQVNSLSFHPIDADVLFSGHHRSASTGSCKASSW